MDKKNLIKEEAGRLGIDVIGFASCAPLFEIEEALRKRESMGYLSGFEEKDIQKRINPKLLMQDCKTIIAGAISYNVEGTLAPSQKDLKFKCHISKAALGIDYHKVLREKFKSLSEFIKQNFHANTEIHVDTGPLVEREIAKRAGIGFIGKNCSVINRNFGSYIFIGEILTDIFIEPDNPADDSCGDCDLCIRACPSKALCDPYTVNAKKCISYHTQSKEIPFDTYKTIGKNIYGCDICQSVCPKNKNAALSKHKEFIPDEWNIYPDAANIIDMDNKTFEGTFKNTSSGWRGKKTLQRNAIIALSNSGDRNAAQYIEKMLSDNRRDIREVSIYALYNLLGKDSIETLKGHMEKEEDEKNRQIITNLINRQ